jgi:hypothetical protein
MHTQFYTSNKSVLRIHKYIKGKKKGEDVRGSGGIVPHFLTSAVDGG